MHIHSSGIDLVTIGEVFVQVVDRVRVLTAQHLANRGPEAARPAHDHEAFAGDLHAVVVVPTYVV